MKTGIEHLAFVKEAFKSLFKTGTLLPSSHFLSDKICEKALKYSSVNNPSIIEVGAGTGKITIPLLNAFPNSHFLIFEPNKSFFEILKSKVESLSIGKEKTNILIINECVENSQEIQEKYHIIVSSLPLLSFNKSHREKVLSFLRDHLLPNGIFIQYGYTPLTEIFLRRYFTVVERSLVPLNIPPAIVYVCKKADKTS